ncbi:MAG: uncharacterized protein JWQ71_3713 [Pedosphaera sp.]|nr:uncharacterized protein [Pedosphaera sp.]
MKPSIHLVIAIFALIVCSTGCRNPINAKIESRYYQAGDQAEKGGDLELARKDYNRSYCNAVAGNLGFEAEAYPLYEWSRVTGYLGMYADAEQGFIKTLTLIDKAKGKADKLRAPTLCELAWLLFDTKEHARAIPVFEAAVQELERRDALHTDPVSFAEFLDDYAESLKAAGFIGQAEAIAQRSAAIREQNQGASPKFKRRRYIT